MGDRQVSLKQMLDAVDEMPVMKDNNGIEFIMKSLVKMRIGLLPSAQPEISRIEQELHGKTPEEQYDFICWLLLKFALAYTDSRLAVSLLIT